MSKRINAFEGAMKTIKVIGGLESVDRSDVFNTKVGKIVIDTVRAFDTCEWETGIQLNKVNDNWIIVQQYKNGEQAQKGHQNWVDKLTKNPNLKLKDINVWEV